MLQVADYKETYHCMLTVDRDNVGGKVFDLKTGTQRPVSGGYPLRNWKNVHDIHVARRPNHTATVAIRFDNGLVYACPFASYDVLLGWLHRPVFRGQVVYVGPRAYVIGSTDYKELCNGKTS